MAIRSSVLDTVCVVTVVGEDSQTEAQSQERACSAVESETDIIAVHANGGDGAHILEIPRTIKQALDSEDAEYWAQAILDEVANLEDVFMAFGPPVPRTSNMSVTPTRFLFSKKIVSLEQRKQDSKSNAYKSIPGSSDYERYRARLLYVNNKFTSVQSSWEELFAPVVDKTSVRIFLATCAMHNKHLLHLDIVSAYLHAVITGPPRFITLWGDEPGTARQLFKAMNGVDNAAQLWNKHFHKFMLQEGFTRTSRDACIYTHPESLVQSSLYVDDILVSSDPDKKAPVG